MPSGNPSPPNSLYAALLPAADDLCPLAVRVWLLAGHGLGAQLFGRARLLTASVIGGAAQALYADVQWSQAVGPLKGGGLTGASGDRRIRRVAALAGGVFGDASDTDCGLDRGNLGLVLGALLHGNGGHQCVFLAPEGQASSAQASAPRPPHTSPSWPLGGAMSGGG